MPVTRHPALLLLVGTLALAVVVGWCARGPALRVQLSSATVEDLSITVSTNGTVEPVEDTIVRARFNGRVVAIAEPGTRVEAGAVVLQLDEGPVAAELVEARSKRLAVQESLRAARAEVSRLRETAVTDAQLYREGAITRSRHAETRAALDDAEARLENLEEEVPLRVAGLDLQIEELAARRDATVVHSPFAGTVYRTEHKVGATVSAGEPVLRIADLDRLRVRINIDQVDLGRVRQDQPITVTSNAYLGRQWNARVEELVPYVAMKESRAVADGLAPLEQPTDGLVPGMRVDVEILVERIPDALQVPARAIFTSAGTPYVYRVAAGRARATPVSLGRADTHAVEIVEGLAMDDVVVLGPATGLGDGDRVVAANAHDRRS